MNPTEIRNDHNRFEFCRTALWDCFLREKNQSYDPVVHTIHTSTKKFLLSYRKVPKVTTPRKKRPFESSDKISHNKCQKKRLYENNGPPKVATWKVISLLARNNGNYSYNKLYQTDPGFIWVVYIVTVWSPLSLVLDIDIISFNQIYQARL